MKRSFLGKIAVLLVVICLAIYFYLTFNTYGNFEFALRLRGKKILAFILVALGTSVSTIAFQTLTKNQFLTPSILGLDNMYVMIQTLLFFFVGGVNMLAKESSGLFLASIGLMTIMSTIFIQFFINRSNGQLFLLLMVGTISGTLFSSISTFLQVLMDPNEYDLLQGKLFASFSNVDSQHLVLAAVLILIGSSVLWLLSPELDVLHLGRDHAVNFGISFNRFQKICLLTISVLTGTATALVGPTIFLGFIVATISYQLFHTYHHRQLFLGSFLVGVILLIGGQFMVEQVFGWKTTISTVVEFTGGLFFIAKILLERKRL